MNRLLYFILLLAAPALLNSCSSKIFGGKKANNKAGQKVISGSDTVQKLSIDPVAPVGTGVPVPTAGNAALMNEVAPIWSRRMAFHTFSGKAKVGFEGPNNSVDFSANFRILKDSVIWAHISALGGIVSVARILITPDSFFLINYQQKEITRLHLRDAGKILPVAVKFTQLQSLFTGDPLSEGTLISASSDEASWSLQTDDQTFEQEVTYRKSDSCLTAGHLRAKAANGTQALTNYFNYILVDSRKLSSNRTVKIQNGLDNYSLDMDIVNPEFDHEVSFPFTVPKNYSEKKYGQ
jgi:hypothetical protein